VRLIVTDDDGDTCSLTKSVNVSDHVNEEPVANFTYTTSNLIATFQDQSTDPDGNIVAWNWDFGDGGTTALQNPIHIYSASGTYTVILTVTDNNLATNSISKNITVSNGTNNPPVANFTYTTSALTVNFQNQSTDSDGNITAWNWDFGDGNSSVEQNPVHNYTTSGTYTVPLSVTDNGNATNSTSQNITVTETTNNPPVADFTFTTSGLTVTLNDQSTDTDGTIVAWNWNFGDGSTSTEQNPIYNYTSSGNFSVQLSVTDNNGDTDVVSKNVVVEEQPNQPPVANFTYTTSELTATFTDQSTDPDGNIIAWNWDFGDGGTTALQNPVHIYSANGTYTVTLTVTDNNYTTNSMSKNVTVTIPLNNPPVADFSYTTSELTVTFTDQSTDTDGTIVAWNWNFGDGSTSTEQNPIHTYSAGGNFTVQLSVTDNNGDTDIVSKNVTVEEQANLPPIANFNYTTSDLIAYFYDQSTDPDGNIIGWNWDFGDGGTTSLQNPVHIYSANRTYTVTLTVTDNNFASNSYSQNVTVTKPVNNPPVADFTYSTSDLIVTFTDQSTDPDGNIIAWNWNFGDGGSSGVQNPVHIYPSSGIYSVTLTVSDNKFVSNSTTKNIIITDSNVNNIILNASGYVIRGRNNVDLNWSGATSNKIEVFRNENLILSTKNDGLHTDTIGKNNGTYIYKIREQGTSNWSNEVTVIF